MSTHQHLLAASAVLLPLSHPGTSGCRLLQLKAIICTRTSRKSIQPSTSLPETSVFIARQGYPRAVSLTHGIILPNGHSQHSFFHFCSLNQRQRKRKKRGNGRSDTELLGDIKIRKFWVAGLLMQPFSKEKACSRKPVLQSKVLSEGSKLLWLAPPNTSNFEDTLHI